jgi:hypothetical protein
MKMLPELFPQLSLSPVNELLSNDPGMKYNNALDILHYATNTGPALEKLLKSAISNWQAKRRAAY